MEYPNYCITEGGQNYVKKRRQTVRLIKRKVAGKMKKVKIKAYKGENKKVKTKMRGKFNKKCEK